MVDSPHLVRPGKRFKLAGCKTDTSGKFSGKDAAASATQKNLDCLGELQEILYAEGRHALLVVLQAMDTGGKDGTIEHVFDAVDPQGCMVTSFKVPTPLELAHDFLWRVHNAVPPRGMIGIFNRSHYESVIVERVKDLVPRKVWSNRYDHINAFERLLAAEGVTILKFFLHISRQEQKERLQARLDDPAKRWKFNPNDVEERKRWNRYMDAYQDALERCSTEEAPWYVIPADKKWYRNWAVSDVIVRTMEKMDLKYPEAAPGLRKIKIPD